MRTAGLLTVAIASPAFGDYKFNTLVSFNESDGLDVQGVLVISDNTLYGTTSAGGDNGGWGTVFSVPVGGGAVTTLCSFGPAAVPTGVAPKSGLVLSGGTLYGTLSATLSPGVAYSSGNYGNVFSLPVTGGSPTNLETFPFHASGGPTGGLIISGNTLYGIANIAPSGMAGVYSIGTDGSDPATISDLTPVGGDNPMGTPLLLGTKIFGSVSGGGSADKGAIFSVPLTGGTPTVVASFSGPNGEYPYSNLITHGGLLYGTTLDGGVYGDGTVFSVPITGGTPTVLASFDGNDGGNPWGGLVLIGDTLYGTTEGAVDPSDYGTVFSLPIAGGTPTTILAFDGENGGNPRAGLTADSQGNLYGTTSYGGDYDDGTVFELSLTVPEPAGLPLGALGAITLAGRVRSPRSRRGLSREGTKETQFVGACEGQL